MAKVPARTHLHTEIHKLVSVIFNDRVGSGNSGMSTAPQYCILMHNDIPGRWNRIAYLNHPIKWILLVIKFHIWTYTAAITVGSNNRGCDIYT